MILTTNNSLIKTILIFYISNHPNELCFFSSNVDLYCDYGDGHGGSNSLSQRQENICTGYQSITTQSPIHIVTNTHKPKTVERVEPRFVEVI